MASGISTAFADLILADEDHFDRVHLSEAGGAKLARFVSPFVRKKADELGYAR
jgi:hypothetical protein